MVSWGSVFWGFFLIFFLILTEPILLLKIYVKVSMRLVGAFFGGVFLLAFLFFSYYPVATVRFFACFKLALLLSLFPLLLSVLPFMSEECHSLTFLLLDCY